ncbi:HAMP domain-containing histidine kinase [Christensenellaceae bacterium OttesenSCG-928-K19]|nr:HAMP domain-containing histidine kinase [Christensenellaceae bacterium OttesenSCG-928-K19]
MENFLYTQRINSHREEMSSVAVQVAPYLEQSDAVEMYNIATKSGNDIGGRILVLSSSGIVQVDSFSQYNGWKLTVDEVNDIIYGKNSASYGKHNIYDGATGNYFPVLYTTSSVMSGGEIIGAVLLSARVTDVVDALASLRMQMLWAYLFTSVIIFLSSMLLTNFIVRPVQELTNVAMKISNGDLESRAHIEGKSELAELGQTFNMMCDRLQNVDRQRSEFVSDASHELKTPLASMKILVESLLYQDHVEEPVYKEFLSDINGEIDRLNGLITDLLLLSKMDNDILSINVEWVSLRDIVNKCAHSLEPIAEKKEITVDVQVADEVSIECDPLKLRQAVNNLIENAIKYTGENGHVYVTIRRAGQEAQIRIEDNGVGMKEEHLAHIFERFYRVDKARARGTGGTGLGLHIVRRIALMHGGRVEVESNEGKGSVFTLVLPIQSKREEK